MKYPTITDYPAPVKYWADGYRAGIALAERRRRGKRQIRMLTMPPAVHWIAADDVLGASRSTHRQALKALRRHIKLQRAGGMKISATVNKAITEVAAVVGGGAR